MAERAWPEMAEYYFHKAYEAQMAGNLDEAVELYKKSIEIYPTAEAHTFLGWTYSFQGRYDDAILECHQAIEVDPDFGNPYNDIGAYLIELQRYEEAIPWLKKAMEARRYEPRQYPHFNLSRVYVRLGKFREAIAEIEKALEIEPDYVLARRELHRLVGMLN
ncbi:MAG: tetratricopeptide repeat protein [Candidatus Rokubacteria bacterium]|nr:tetratricopeptide repeat protein [Candidatus Rokubacteria bacterium]